MSTYIPVTGEPLSVAERRLEHVRFLMLREIADAAIANDAAEVRRLVRLLP